MRSHGAPRATGLNRKTHPISREIRPKTHTRPQKSSQARTTALKVGRHHAQTQAHSPTVHNCAELCTKRAFPSPICHPLIPSSPPSPGCAKFPNEPTAPVTPPPSSLLRVRLRVLRAFAVAFSPAGAGRSHESPFRLGSTLPNSAYL